MFKYGETCYIHISVWSEWSRAGASHIVLTGHKGRDNCKKNRLLHGFGRHLGCVAVAAKITANVWEILQLSTLITPQLHVQF